MTRQKVEAGSMEILGNKRSCLKKGTKVAGDAPKTRIGSQKISRAMAAPGDSQLANEMEGNVTGWSS